MKGEGGSNCRKWITVYIEPKSICLASDGRREPKNCDTELVTMPGPCQRNASMARRQRAYRG